MMEKETFLSLASSTMSVIASALAAILLLYIFQLRSILRSSKWKLSGKKLAPGPKPWPVVGNLLSILGEPYEALVDLAKIYGPVMSLQIGTRSAIVFSTAAMAKAILKTHDKCFGHRPTSAAIGTWAEKLAPVFFLGRGEEWADIKKLLAIELMTSKRIEYTQAGRTEEVRLALQALVESTERSVQAGLPVSEKPSELICQLTGNVITRAVFGKRIFTATYTDFETNDFAKALVDAVHLLSSYDLRDAFTFMREIDVQGHSKHLLAAKQRIRSFVLPHVIAREEEIRNGSRKNNVDEGDFLDMLFSNEMMGGTMSNFLKAEVIMALHTATIASTSNVIDWVLTELLRKPECIKKCQEQLDTVVGRDRLVSESDLPNLPYLRAVLLESIRLHPLAAFLVPRESQWDTEIAGYFVPAKTLTLINVRAINREPATWPNPDEFIPDRHFKSPDGDVDVNTDDFSMMTFGAGRRSCPGKKPGWRILQLILATFLHALDFEVAAGVQPEALNMSTQMRMDGPRAEPLHVTPTLRIPRSVIFA